MTSIAAVATVRAASAGWCRAIRPPRIVSSRPDSSSRRVEPAISPMPSSGSRNEARNPNSSWITPPRLSIPSTWPLIAASALPEVTASA